ncbi:MAG: hypothetical protein WC250_00150 [Candidatus Paceibacterota bacterium]|jgi:hypothetical protein
MKDMKKPPKSYLNSRRPTFHEAAALEGGTFMEAMASLERKGYFEPAPGPWKLGIQDRGIGRNNFAILDRFGDLVVEAPSRATADLIIAAVNASRKKKK